MKATLFALTLALLSVLLVKGCGSSSSSGSSDDDSFVLPLALLDIDVSVNSGSSQNTVDVPPAPRSNYTQFSVDAAATLNSVNFSTNSPRAAAIRASRDEPLELSIKFGSNQATVCSSGFEFGPFNMTLDEGMKAVGVTPASVDSNPATVNVVNKGAFYMCIQLQTPIDLQFTVPSVTMSQQTCDIGYQDVSGTWSGSYSCENTGCADEGGSITLNINQDEYAASYDDDQAHYDGTVCGNEFAFNGGVEGSYTEEGSFTLINASTASKTSTFESIIDSCRGTCTDTLTRVSP